jgi:hypothetical protein
MDSGAIHLDNTSKASEHILVFITLKRQSAASQMTQASHQIFLPEEVSMWKL